MAQGEAREASPTTPLSRIRLGFMGLGSITSATLGATTEGGTAGDTTVSTRAVAPAPAQPAVDGAGSGAEAATPTAATSAAALTAWADRARKAVSGKAREVAYNIVPQGDGSAGSKGGNGAASAEVEGPDMEKGEARDSLWAGWVQATANRVKHQVSEAAQEARQGIAQAAGKAKSLELGEQAKGWQSEVKRGFGKVADGATTVSSALTDKGKVAQQKAKELQGKTSQKLAEAKEKGVAKAKDAKDKASAAAGVAKAGLSKAGHSISGGLSGFTALALSPAKLAQFGGVFFLGTLLISLSFSFLPVLVIAPQKFALLFAFGSVTLLSSFAILKGPKAFVAGLTQQEKLPFSVAYAVGLVGTLVATIGLRSFLLTAIFGVIQAVALLYFLASHVPGGKALLNGCGRMCGRLARSVACRSVQ